MSDPVLFQIDARGVATVTLNRPERRNAFDGATIARLDATFAWLGADDTVRLIVLTGTGDTFSSGADLAHMRAMLAAGEQENFEDALGLAKLLKQMSEIDKPLLARVNGNAFGGALGLIACADIAVATESARLALSEVRLGLIPATISPYVIEAIGARAARRLFLSGETLSADDARSVGLIHVVAPAARLDEVVGVQIEYLLQGAPGAQRAAKRLVRRFAAPGVAEREDREIYTARQLARIRVGEEAQEGMGAFLGKRKPRWSP